MDKEGTIDIELTLFIRRTKGNLVGSSVCDDIIFGSTNKSWCEEFEALMQSRFQMSSMGELTFFLGLQVKRTGGIFIFKTICVCSRFQVLLGIGKDDAGSTWTWKGMQLDSGFSSRRSKLRYALTHNPPIYDSLVKQFWQTATARTLADGTQQLNATIDSIEYTIRRTSTPTLPPSPQIPSPSYHDTEGPSFEPSYHMSPPPSHEPEIQTSRPSEESEQLRNLLDTLVREVKKLENKLRKKRKSEETKDAEGQDQEVPSQTAQRHCIATPDKEQRSGVAQGRYREGSQAPLGSKIYRRKPKSKPTPTKILHFEEPAETQVNTGSTPSAQVNTAEVNTAELNTVRIGRAREEEAAMKHLLTEFVLHSSTGLNADQILVRTDSIRSKGALFIGIRAKFLHETIAAQRKFLAEQRYAAIKNKPPTISQLRNQMITYLKHVANKKHAELKSKSFEEIQVLYERYKKQDQTFVAIGSEEDERAIKKMNEKDIDKEQKADSVHEEVKEEEGAKKRKLGTRRKLKAKRRKHASGLTREDDDLKICLHIAPDEDKVIDVESLDHQYPIIEWQSFFLTTKPQYDQTKPDEDIYLNKVTRTNGHQRFFCTLMGVLSILDREDLKVIYELVMEKYQDDIPEGFDKMLWGDLMIMFNQGDNADFWDEQLDWKIISWKLHSSSGQLEDLRDLMMMDSAKSDHEREERSFGDKKTGLGDDASKQGRIDIGDINTDAEITLIDETQGRINDIIADEDITLIPKLIIKLLKM
ncbi:hypothetical protein Tco_0543481 [Tanacetum coccineum]